MFGLFRKKPKYPIVKTDMIEPVDAPIDIPTAKNFYREYMKQTGFLDKEEIGYHLEDLAEEIHLKTEMFKDLVEEKKDRVDMIKDKISELKTQLESKIVQADEYPKSKIEVDIYDLEQSLEFGYERHLRKAQEELATFKKDKREFIIDYINTEVHGYDWKSKLT